MHATGIAKKIIFMRGIGMVAEVVAVKTMSNCPARKHISIAQPQEKPRPPHSGIFIRPSPVMGCGWPPMASRTFLTSSGVTSPPLLPHEVRT